MACSVRRRSSSMANPSGAATSSTRWSAGSPAAGGEASGRQNASVDRPVDVASRQDQADLRACAFRSVLEQRRERGGAGTLGNVVGVAEVVAHGIHDGGVGDLDDPL